MNIFEILAGVSNGTIDARKEVLNKINGMNPAQRQRLKAIIPQVQRIAKQVGIPADDLTEIGAHL